MSTAYGKAVLAWLLLVACVGQAQEMGGFSLRERDHVGWQQTNVFISPERPILSFDWLIRWNSYHGQGSSDYVINERLSVGYDNRFLDRGPYPDNGIDEIYLWSSLWHYVGLECNDVPQGGFTGHTELDLSELAGRTVSLWFYLDYVPSDSGNDCMASFGGVTLQAIPEPAGPGFAVCAIASLILRWKWQQRTLATPARA